MEEEEEEPEAPAEEEEAPPPAEEPRKRQPRGRKAMATAAAAPAAAPDAEADQVMPDAEPPQMPEVGDRLQVEVEENGRTTWREGAVVEAKRGKFVVVLVGRKESADTFRETYTMRDHGTEWRWPKQQRCVHGPAKGEVAEADPLQHRTICHAEPHELT